MQTIQIRSRGDAVKQWQKILGIKEDGAFGPQTRAATMEWQRGWNNIHPNDQLSVDGIVGPKTWERAMKPGIKIAIGSFGALLLASIASSLLGTDENKLRNKVASAAESQLDNTDPTPYWKDVIGGTGGWPKDWCGAFALWCLHQAGLALDVKWLVSKGFLLAGKYPLNTVSVPKVGDIAYFHKSQHHAVVKKVNADGTVDLINGNGFNPDIQNGAISEVAASNVRLSQVDAFYSIQRFIDQKLAAA